MIIALPCRIFSTKLNYTCLKWLKQQVSQLMFMECIYITEYAHMGWYWNRNQYQIFIFVFGIENTRYRSTFIDKHLQSLSWTCHLFAGSMTTLRANAYKVRYQIATWWLINHMHHWAHKNCMHPGAQMWNDVRTPSYPVISTNIVHRYTHTFQNNIITGLVLQQLWMKYIVGNITEVLQMV